MSRESGNVAIRPEPEPRLLPTIEEGTLGRVRRLDVYAEAYFLRLHDALAEDFTTVKAALGDERFQRFAAEYLARHPSTSPNIEVAGSRLPAFAAEHRFRTHVPALADLAALDWAALRAFVAIDVPPFDGSRLADRAPEAWNDATFRIDASVSAMATAWPVDLAWREEYNGAELREEKVRLVVYRVDEEVHVERFEPLAFELLRGMMAGKTLGKLGETAEACGGSADAVQTVFASLVGRGIVREVIF